MTRVGRFDIGRFPTRQSFEKLILTDEPNGVAATKLLCTNLPPECNEAIMGALFGQ